MAPKRRTPVSRELAAVFKFWNQHICDEIKIHRALITKKKDMKEHAADTVRIHKTFLDKLKKLAR